MGSPKSRMFTFSSCLMVLPGFFYPFMLDLGITANWPEGGWGPEAGDGVYLGWNLNTKQLDWIATA